ncbi:extracellular solute-binding protein [Paenibacillus glycanilyticus]|uniref:extracellular solute-binding protein n=1 Tax=Paenibacillus glycanilyticus TaxID=126569 RepID=UPI00203AB6F8|nr:extracellular solute-binding protein [Paenibacillus glycanilyticus]MCM3629856.1 extracellular solute-binding protein [Paenibacillus glycanilyticus]
MLTSLMLLSALSACENENNAMPPKEQEKVTPAPVINTDPAFSRYDPPIELSFVRQVGEGLEGLIADLPGETLEDNRWTRLDEDMLGIKIKYDWKAKGDLYGQKLGASIASGNIPDVVQVNAQQLRELSNAGLIQDLTQIYGKYASPLTQKVLSEEGDGPFETATIDGKLMGIPQTSSSIEDADLLWIRTDWLKRLGLKPPKTMDDLLAISKAFTERDPDRNGKNDTYGIAATKYLGDPVMGLVDLMAGYNAFPNIWIKDKQGKLVYGGIQPEVKTALKVIQDMYSEGQLDPEFALKDGEKAGKMITAGKIGMIYGEQWASFLVQTNRDMDPNADWQAYPIVSATGQASKVPLKFSTNTFFAIKKGYEHPEAIVKLFNLHLEKNWGESAEYQKYYNTTYPVWQLSPVTPYPTRKNLEAFRQIEEARKTGNYANLKDEAIYIKKRMDDFVGGDKNGESGWGWYKTYGPTGAFSIIDQYERNNQLLYESFVGAPTDTMIDKQQILGDLQDETYINIILGRPIDDFDQFVQDWYKLGGDKITTEVNQWYEQRRYSFVKTAR